MRKGFTLVEILMSMGVMFMGTLGLLALYGTGLRSMQRTMVDTDVSQSNAQGVRHVAESIREAVEVSISTDGKTLNYKLPKRASVIDLSTGEKEYVVPLAWDGLARSFTIASGKLVDSVTGKTLVRNLLATDPLPTSSQYNQTYDPFSLSTIGSSRAVQINLIVQDQVGQEKRYARMKTTVIIRNLQ